MSFWALPLLTPADKCICLFDSPGHILLLPALTEHNNAAIKEQFLVKLQPSPWQRRLCVCLLRVNAHVNVKMPTSLSVHTSFCWWVMRRLKHRVLVRSLGYSEKDSLVSGFYSYSWHCPCAEQISVSFRKEKKKQAFALIQFQMETAATGVILPMLSWLCVIAELWWSGAQLRARWSGACSVTAAGHLGECQLLFQRELERGRVFATACVVTTARFSRGGGSESKVGKCA